MPKKFIFKKYFFKVHTLPYVPGIVVTNNSPTGSIPSKYLSAELDCLDKLIYMCDCSFRTEGML